MNESRRRVNQLAAILGWCAGLALLVSAAGSTAPIEVAGPTEVAIGQSATLLPDGEWLLLGGRTAGGQVTGQAVLLDSSLRRREVLAQGLNVPRAGESALVLPDGTVLIIGGRGVSGQPVADVERYHPDTRRFEDLGNFGLPALSGESATLLTDGRVLIAGGSDVTSLVRNDVELLDPSTMTFSSGGSLAEARTDHQMELLPGGDVLLWGGVDQAGQPVNSAEVYDISTERSALIDWKTFTRLLSEVETAAAPTIEATLPQAASTGLPVNSRLSVRFSKPLNPVTVTNRTFTLFGPAGTVDVRVVAAGGGLLAFLTPTEDLFPGSRYTLFIKGAADPAGRSVPFTAIDFQTVRLLNTSAGQQVIFRLRKSATKSDAENLGLWIPSKQNFGGVWRSGQAHLARNHLPRRTSVAKALYGITVENGLRDSPAGVTAVAGQVLQLNGEPLARVTLSIGTKSAETDLNGEFLLSEVPAGPQVLVIDGSTANRGARQYGRYEYRAILQPRETNALPFVIWMTRLDTRNSVTIPSPTTAETIITNPNIPGLELKIPAGTVIRDSQGKIVTKISITPIPIDQPPFPLPNREVPVYFTIQPGGARLDGLNPNAAQGAQLIYPNFQRAPPGTRMDFWNYDPTEKGWYIYGQGTVSSNDKQIVPDPGVAIYEFTGAMTGSPANAPAFGGKPCGGNGSKIGDPVDCFTGLYTLKRTDLYISDSIPISVERTYRPLDGASRAFGIGTNLNYDIFLVGSINPYTYQELILPDGGQVYFSRTSPGTSYVGAVYRTQTPGSFFGATLSYNGQTNAYWVLQLPDGTVYDFPESYLATARCSAAIGMQDRNGNSLTLVRDGNCNLTSISSPSGRSITFTYDSSNRITQATDNAGRTVKYQYDSGGRLSRTTDPMGNTESYNYDSSNDLLTITDKRNNLVLTNDYDTNSRVVKQTFADGSFGTFNYTEDATGLVTAMTYTDPRGSIKQVQFNSAGYPTSVSRAYGTPYEETDTYARDPNTNLVTSVTDALGRVTAFQYDANGRVTQVTYLSGTSNATTWSYTYGGFEELTSVTDPINHTTSYGYDDAGNLTSVTNPLGDSVALQHNSSGRVVSITEYAGGTPLTTTFNYLGSDLASITDPLGRETQFRTDRLGRTIAIVDALGNATQIAYDALDEVTQRTDPLGNTLKYGYDPNGNEVSFTDARSVVTSFGYDNMNRMTSETDPLGQAASYSYDGDGNLVQVIDRKGQVSGFTYDLLNRRTGAGYGATTGNPSAYVSTIAYVWDAADRLTQAVDSASGPVTRTYDGLDDLTGEETPQGQIAYAYYPNRLKESMTVQGQTAVSYSYDAADRLTQISQGSASVSIAYDSAYRRTSVTLPNGVQMNYSYDGASEITAIAYQSGAAALGNLAYSYDADGRRIGLGGSLAQLVLPAAVSSASYDAANRQTSWGAAGLNYDANGSLTAVGSSTYTWNERNELVAASDGNSSFGYDAFGRRTSKTVAGTTTSYLQDGDNPVLVNGSMMLAGPGPDEYYAQVSSSGTTGLLRDALGNVFALTDGTGAIVGNYAYEPYGAATQSGGATIPFQFTARENEGATGLYYFRARYYSPERARFISQDPLDLRAGANWYAYVAGDPISRVDPSGEASGEAGFDMRGAAGAAGETIESDLLINNSLGDAFTDGLLTGFEGGLPGPLGFGLATLRGGMDGRNGPGGSGLGAAGGAAGFMMPDGLGIPFSAFMAITSDAEMGIFDLAKKLPCK